MNLASLSSADFKRIAKLLQKKEALLAQVAQLDAVLSGYSSGKSKPAKARGQTGKRGKLKQAILAALQKAGKSGLTVKELAAQVKRTPANIHTWFFNTGKGIKQVKKIGESKWAWVE